MSISFENPLDNKFENRSGLTPQIDKLNLKEGTSSCNNECIENDFVSNESTPNRICNVDINLFIPKLISKLIKNRVSKQVIKDIINEIIRELDEIDVLQWMDFKNYWKDKAGKYYYFLI